MGVRVCPCVYMKVSIYVCVQVFYVYLHACVPACFRAYVAKRCCATDKQIARL